jgi:hypothetical protein
VFLVDNAHLGDPRHTVSASGEVVRRSLSDGRQFEIVKRFWAPTELERELAALGWQLSAGATPTGISSSPPANAVSLGLSELNGVTTAKRQGRSPRKLLRAVVARLLGRRP